MSTKVNFTQTTSSQLANISKRAGTLYFCTDTSEIYVDQMIDDVVERVKYSEGGSFVRKSGDTMTGPLNVQSDSSHKSIVTDHSISLKPNGTESYFYAGDAVDSSSPIPRIDTFKGDGATIEFFLSAIAASTDYIVKVNGSEVTEGVDKFNTSIALYAPPLLGATITVEYDITTLRHYDLGIRDAASNAGSYSTVEGWLNIANGQYSHAEGNRTTASGYCSHAEGSQTTASGQDSHVEGYSTTASGRASHAEGSNTTASGKASHAEGIGTTASGYSSHAEGSEAIASGYASHAEGYSSTASGHYSHAEGYNNTASQAYSHAEGSNNTASGSASHAEGSNTTASGIDSHAEGYGSIASGTHSHAQNLGTIAQRKSQTALGEYNIADTQSTAASRGKYAVIVGNGTADNARSNALTIDWSGNVEASGDVTDGSGNVLSAKADASSLPPTLKTTTIKFTLASQTWTASVGGKFYLAETAAPKVTDATKIYAVSLTNQWQGLRTTDFIQPIILPAVNRISLVANTNSFLNTSSAVEVQVLYI